MEWWRLLSRDLDRVRERRCHRLCCPDLQGHKKHSSVRGIYLLLFLLPMLLSYELPGGTCKPMATAHVCEGACKAHHLWSVQASLSAC